MSIKLPIYKVKLVRDHVASFPSGIVEEPKATAEFFHDLIGMADREHLAALFVSMGRPTGATIIGVGTISKVGTDMRETFKAAMLAGAESIILAHNHPSGMAIPSPEDIRMTLRMCRAGTLLGIEVADHFIVSPLSGDFSSMRTHAELWRLKTAAETRGLVVANPSSGEHESTSANS